ncbi:uncharacterized protein SCODWIG_01230 [Saccharomycodes ludwigii]|uniref:Copper-fist domain-containing protein n=1 Tax=Saccharomycodes ludwigii TaxID=36035 RepID=A0A376B4G2_9ASCO|nr:uncharacterized protein SCODWIG_01230 [Saccharomycodes ludwigii]
MVLIKGVKYACERCIRGHRVTGCTHTDQPLMMIKPKGRPSTACQHCKNMRKNKNINPSGVCTCGRQKKIEEQKRKQRERKQQQGDLVNDNTIIASSCDCEISEKCVCGSKRKNTKKFKDVTSITGSTRGRRRKITTNIAKIENGTEGSNYFGNRNGILSRSTSSLSINNNSINKLTDNQAVHVFSQDNILHNNVQNSKNKNNLVNDVPSSVSLRSFDISVNKVTKPQIVSSTSSTSLIYHNNNNNNSNSNNHNHNNHVHNIANISSKQPFDQELWTDVQNIRYSVLPDSNKSNINNTSSPTNVLMSDNNNSNNIPRFNPSFMPSESSPHNNNDNKYSPSSHITNPMKVGEVSIPLREYIPNEINGIGNINDATMNSSNIINKNSDAVSLQNSNSTLFVDASSKMPTHDEINTNDNNIHMNVNSSRDNSYSSSNTTTTNNKELFVDEDLLIKDVPWPFQAATTGSGLLDLFSDTSNPQQFIKLKSKQQQQQQQHSTHRFYHDGATPPKLTMSTNENSGIKRSNSIKSTTSKAASMVRNASFATYVNANVNGNSVADSNIHNYSSSIISDDNMRAHELPPIGSFKEKGYRTSQVLSSSNSGVNLNQHFVNHHNKQTRLENVNNTHNPNNNNNVNDTESIKSVEVLSLTPGFTDIPERATPSSNPFIYNNNNNNNNINDSTDTVTGNKHNHHNNLHNNKRYIHTTAGVNKSNGTSSVMALKHHNTGGEHYSSYKASANTSINNLTKSSNHSQQHHGITKSKSFVVNSNNNSSAVIHDSESISSLGLSTLENSNVVANNNSANNMGNFPTLGSFSSYRSNGSPYYPNNHELSSPNNNNFNANNASSTIMSYNIPSSTATKKEFGVNNNNNNNNNTMVAPSVDLFDSPSSIMTLGSGDPAQVSSLVSPADSHNTSNNINLVTTTITNSSSQSGSGARGSMHSGNGSANGKTIPNNNNSSTSVANHNTTGNTNSTNSCVSVPYSNKNDIADGTSDIFNELETLTTDPANYFMNVELIDNLSNVSAIRNNVSKHAAAYDNLESNITVDQTNKTGNTNANFSIDGNQTSFNNVSPRQALPNQIIYQSTINTNNNNNNNTNELGDLISGTGSLLNYSSATFNSSVPNTGKHITANRTNCNNSNTVSPASVTSRNLNDGSPNSTTSSGSGLEEFSAIDRLVS